MEVLYGVAALGIMCLIAYCGDRLRQIQRAQERTAAALETIANALVEDK